MNNTSNFPAYSKRTKKNKPKTNTHLTVVLSIICYREKSEIHNLVIQGGSFKGKSDLKTKEVKYFKLKEKKEF